MVHIMVAGGEAEAVIAKAGSLRLTYGDQAALNKQMGQGTIIVSGSD